MHANISAVDPCCVQTMVRINSTIFRIMQTDSKTTNLVLRIDLRVELRYEHLNNVEVTAVRCKEDEGRSVLQDMTRYAS